MPKRHANSDEKVPKRRKISADEVLVEAARNGDTAAVRAGLEKLSPVAAWQPERRTVVFVFDAVHEACRGNHDECLALLLPYVETTQMGFGMLLSECVHADHTACTEVLLQHWKSVCSNVAFVPHGLEEGSDGQAPRACPAMWADPAVCQVLIDAGADIKAKDSNGRSPLHWASEEGHLANVKLLVEAGAEVRSTDNKGRTCLFSAAPHTETVRYLVGLPDVEVDHVDDTGCTALHRAVMHKRADVVQVLVDAGADVEVLNGDGRSPLHVASKSGERKAVQILLEAGAGMRVTDYGRQTYLALAAAAGHTATVRSVAGLPGVELNHQDEHGCTALHCAARGGHLDAVQVLLYNGADWTLRDQYGCTALGN